MDATNTARQIITEKLPLAHARDGIMICPVADATAGLELASTILEGVVDRRTALFLSGGSTPKPLYERIAKEEKLHPGVVGLVDERFGEPYHDQSNEKMILQSGLIRYLSMRDIQYYSVLRGLPIVETADRYDELVRSLHTVYPKLVGIFGLGKDGHTSSIAPNRSDFINPMFEKAESLKMVSHLHDKTGPFGQRVGMTFLGLSMFDLLIILAFGQEKEAMFQLMFADGKEEDIPARFFRRKDIGPRTILITDCQSL